jgi:transposase InsO family protein
MTAKKPPTIPLPKSWTKHVRTAIAIVERFILTMKQVLARLPMIPLRRESFRNELVMIIQWYNEHRPHESLEVNTPEGSL